MPKVNRPGLNSPPRVAAPDSSPTPPSTTPRRLKRNAPSKKSVSAAIALVRARRSPRNDSSKMDENAMSPQNNTNMLLSSPSGSSLGKVDDKEDLRLPLTPKGQASSSSLSPNRHSAVTVEGPSSPPLTSVGTASPMNANRSPHEKFFYNVFASRAAPPPVPTLSTAIEDSTVDQENEPRDGLLSASPSSGFIGRGDVTRGRSRRQAVATVAEQKTRSPPKSRSPVSSDSFSPPSMSSSGESEDTKPSTNLDPNVVKGLGDLIDNLNNMKIDKRKVVETDAQGKTATSSNATALASIKAVLEPEAMEKLDAFLDGHNELSEFDNALATISSSYSSDVLESLDPAALGDIARFIDTVVMKPPPEKSAASAETSQRGDAPRTVSSADSSLGLNTLDSKSPVKAQDNLQDSDVAKQPAEKSGVTTASVEMSLQDAPRTINSTDSSLGLNTLDSKGPVKAAHSLQHSEDSESVRNVTTASMEDEILQTRTIESVSQDIDLAGENIAGISCKSDESPGVPQSFTEFSLDSLLANSSTMESVHEGENIEMDLAGEHMAGLPSKSEEPRGVQESSHTAGISSKPEETRGVQESFTETSPDPFLTNPSTMEYVHEDENIEIDLAGEHNTGMSSKSEDIPGVWESNTEISVDPLLADPSTMESVNEDENIERFLLKTFTLPEGATKRELVQLNFYISEAAKLLEHGTSEQRQNLVSSAIHDGLPKQFVEDMIEELLLKEPDESNGESEEIFPDPTLPDDIFPDPTLPEPTMTIDSNDGIKERSDVPTDENEWKAAKEVQNRSDKLKSFFGKLAPRDGANADEIGALELFKNLATPVLLGDRLSSYEEEEVGRAAARAGVPESALKELLTENDSLRQTSSETTEASTAASEKLDAILQDDQTAETDKEETSQPDDLVPDYSIVTVGVDTECVELSDARYSNSMDELMDATEREVDLCDARYSNSTDELIEAMDDDEDEDEEPAWWVDESVSAREKDATRNDDAVASQPSATKDGTSRDAWWVDESVPVRVKDATRNDDVVGSPHVVPCESSATKDRTSRAGAHSLTVNLDSPLTEEAANQCLSPSNSRFGGTDDKYQLPPSATRSGLKETAGRHMTPPTSPKSPLESLDKLTTSISRMSLAQKSLSIASLAVSPRRSCEEQTFERPIQRKLGGANAAAVIAKWSPRHCPRKRIPIKQQWKLAYKERIKNHPGYFDVDVYSLYDTSLAIHPPHRLDLEPWEHREVKQRFLHEQSIGFSRNWFGDLARKRGNDKYREPVARPRSMEVPMSRLPERNWEKDWYMTWQAHKLSHILPNDEASCGSYSSGYTSGGDDHTGSLVSGSVFSGSSRNTRSTRETRDPDWDDDEATDEETWYEEDDNPECGHIVNVKQKIGERVSRIHPHFTSSLRRSRWRKKHFPRGTFPY